MNIHLILFKLRHWLAIPMPHIVLLTMTILLRTIWCIYGPKVRYYFCPSNWRTMPTTVVLHNSDNPQNYTSQVDSRQVNLFKFIWHTHLIEVLIYRKWPIIDNGWARHLITIKKRKKEKKKEGSSKDNMIH